MDAPERIWAYSDGLWIEAWDAPPSGAEYIRADLAALTAQVAEKDEQLVSVLQREAATQQRHDAKMEAAEAERDALRERVARLEGALALYSCEDGCNDCPQNERDRVSCGWTARAAITDGGKDA